MKHGIVQLVLIALIVAAVPPVTAQSREWTGGEVMVTLEGTSPLTQSVGWSGDLCYFYIPKSATTMWFAYTGPTWQATPWLWVSPQVGYGGGWNPIDDSVIGAGWVDLTLPKGLGVVSLDGEAIVTGSVRDGYWYNQWNRAIGPFKVGAHYESTNERLKWGPHVSLSKGPWKWEIRYFAGEGEHNIRLVTKLGF
ncbi:MAG: hypothetical protein V1778_01645 [bacterium]